MESRKKGQPELMNEIMSVIETDVKPSLHAHGGDITNVHLEGNVLHFRLIGACSGCPSAWLTGEELLRAPLMERFPELSDVVADTDLDDEMVQLAKDALAGKLPF